MVNITQSNFIEQSNDLIRRLPSAAFVAIDEEMTGISMPNTPRPRKDQTPNERYESLKAVPEKYSIIQLGICLFHEHPNFQANRRGSPEFVARRYNFFMFPPADNKTTREVVLNPSSIAFLNQHNMDFDLWTKQGVPFITGDMAQEKLTDYIEKQREKEEKKASSTGYNPNRRRVELRRTEDIDFHARTMASLREWLDSAQPLQHARGHHGAEPGVPEGLSFLLPPANSFLRRAMYESIQAEYPALVLENAGPEYPNQIRVLRLNPEEQRIREERLRRESWENLIVQQIGVWRVFTALSLANNGLEIPADSITFARTVDDINWEKSSTSLDTLRRGRKIPLVVHCGFLDLAFLLTHFHSHTLPKHFSEAKALLHSYFPMVYDTKFLATECAPASLWNESTHLEGLFIKVIRDNEEASNLVQLAPDVVGGGALGYLPGNEEQAHDAAYDSYMTGAVYIGVCRHIALHGGVAPENQGSELLPDKVGSLKHLLCDESDELVESKFGRNKLYMMQSIYSVDLEKTEDPLCRGMHADAVFRISNFDPSVTTRTIIQCLSDIVDSEYNRISFEIVWVDETTFLVAASRKPPLRSMAERSSSSELEIIKEHGKLIFHALRTRFPREDIVSWNQYTQKHSSVGVDDDESWSSRAGRVLRSILGWTPSSMHASASRKRANESIFLDPSPEGKRRRIIY